MKKWLGIILILVGALSIVGGAWAEEGELVTNDEQLDASSIRVSPSGSRIRLQPGAVLEGEHAECKQSMAGGCYIGVTNAGSTKFTYKVYVTPYIVSGSDNEVTFVDDDGKNAFTQIARWIKIFDKDGNAVDEATFTIAPGETQLVQYRIDVPEDIPGGSQYAAIWTQMVDDGKNSGGIKTLGQVGSVIIGRSATDSNEVVVFSNMKIESFAFKGPLKASGHVKNEGNTDFAVRYIYTARTLFGKEIASGEDTLAAYPGNEYDFEYKWENTPFLGIFQVEFKVQGGNETATKRRIVIIMPLIVLILLILLLTVLIAWIIIIIRKRKERQVRKMV